MEKTMEATKHIALIAHDQMKTSLVEWCRKNYETLSHHFLCGTDSFLGINSFTTPASFIHILTLCIANELGPEALKAIEEDEKQVSTFMYQDADYFSE